MDEREIVERKRIKVLIRRLRFVRKKLETIDFCNWNSCNLTNVFEDRTFRFIVGLVLEGNFYLPDNLVAP